MIIFTLIGICLLILSGFAGVFIFLSSFKAYLDVSASTLWSLFILNFLGGHILFAVGTNKDSVIIMLKISSTFLLLLGLSSAVMLFLNAMNIAPAESTGSLWALFLLCTVVGIALVLAIRADESIDWLGEAKK